VLFLKRPLFIAAAAVAAALCVYRGRGVFALLAALIIGIGLPLAHASLRSPNLKARLASAREEFRAVWCVCAFVFVCLCLCVVFVRCVWGCGWDDKSSGGSRHDANKVSFPHPMPTTTLQYATGGGTRPSRTTTRSE
jgi:hypothetical protein